MTKEYFCAKFKQDGSICGEKNKENFSKSRYSICNECRKLEAKEYRERIKEEQRQEKIKLINPENGITWLINDKFNNFKIDDKSILEHLNYLQDRITNFIELEKRTNKFLYDELNKAVRRITYLEEDNSNLKKEIKKLKKKDDTDNTIQQILPKLSEL
jgi:hypothetical protein